MKKPKHPIQPFFFRYLTKGGTKKRYYGTRSECLSQSLKKNGSEVKENPKFWNKKGR